MINYKAIEQREKEKIDSLRVARMVGAEKAAAILKKRFGVKKVILFGSVARKDGYLHSRSDIDLLVEGIKDEDILKAGYTASVEARPFNVDLVPVGRADHSIIVKAQEEGIEL